MLNSVRRKIKSAPRSVASTTFVVCVLIIVVLFVVVSSQKPTHLPATTNSGKTFWLFVADTEALRKKGLSHKKMIGLSEGMLFVYDKPAVRCVWMKDMHFPIDIIWLSAQKQVVAVERRVFPSSYPEKFCHGSSQYVIELHIAASQGIMPGQQIRF